MAATRPVVKEKGDTFTYEGKNRTNNQSVRGDVVARNEKEARDKLMRRGIQVISIVKVKKTRAKKITSGDVTVFSRQLATMMKSGLPLLQAFDIVAKGHSNPSMTELLLDIRSDIEQGSSMSKAFAKHPKYFDDLFVNLVQAGEAGGVLEDLLDKLATYKEKTESIKKKVKSALTYPTMVVVVAVALIVVMMVFVLPSFKSVYEGMGAKLPALTQTLMNISDFFVAHWFLLLVVVGGTVFGLIQWHKRSPELQKRVDGWLLKAPIFGDIVTKAAIARWGRTTATLFTAGVPLVEALESVAGASGNIIYEEATHKIRKQVAQGTSLTAAMHASQLFPNMFMQMASIGEEAGSLDDMLNKASAYYEEEVDTAVANISSLMEPIIMVVLGGIVGVILVALYLPLFNLGNVVA
ncbi:MAG: type II secretion system F family protein [Neisseriaceae bacterium]|nr:type II secretion system F family protein [Neisseriaceae bacterium]